MNKRNNIVIGIIFVILGGLFLLGTLDIFRIEFGISDIAYIFAYFWPSLFLILPGLAIHSIFFSGKNREAGILVPGGILLVTGITCQVSMLFGLWGVMWPGFILAVAVGLFELYLFGGRHKALLIPVAILTFLSLIFFNTFSLGWLMQFKMRNVLVSVLLIGIGLMIIFRNSFSKKEF